MMGRCTIKTYVGVRRNMLPPLHRLKIQADAKDRKAFLLSSHSPFIQLDYHAVVSKHLPEDVAQQCQSDTYGAGAPLMDGADEQNAGNEPGNHEDDEDRGDEERSPEGEDDAMEVDERRTTFTEVGVPTGVDTKEESIVAWLLESGRNCQGRPSYFRPRNTEPPRRNRLIFVYVKEEGVRRAIVMYRQAPNGSYEYIEPEDRLKNWAKGINLWFVDFQSPVLDLRAIEDILGRLRSGSNRGTSDSAQKRQRMSSLGAAGSVVTPSSFSLLQEYETHCLWLRMLELPCQPSLSAINAINRGDRPTTYIESLPKKEWARISKIVNSSEFKADASQHEDYDTPNKVYIDHMIQLWNATPSCQIEFRQFPHLGANHYGSGGPLQSKTEKYVSWLRYYMVNKTGPLYGGSRLEDYDRAHLNANHENYQLEHINPQSWTHLTTLISQFRYVVSDPTLVFMTWGKSNQERSNKPILFGTNSSADDLYVAWPHPTRLLMAAVAARAVIHATMTYPLLTSTPTDAVLHTCAPTATVGYLKQIDKIVALAVQEPPEWEVMIQLQCYARLGPLNPLVVSERARQELNNADSPFYKLLKRRWAGNDRTSAVLLDTLRSIVDSTCNGDA